MIFPFDFITWLIKDIYSLNFYHFVLQDLENLDPGRGKFLVELQLLATQKHNINIDNNLTQEEKEGKVSQAVLFIQSNWMLV